MGLFDHVKVRGPLPDGFVGELQSKDRECLMATIEITPDGRLRVEDLAKPHSWQDLDYHGVFNFYGRDADETLHDYRAKFTDGQLVGISRQ